MKDDRKNDRRQMLAYMPPAEAAKLLTGAIMNLAEDVTVWAETPWAKQWEPENEGDVQAVRLCNWLVDLVNAWSADMPEPLKPEEMN